MVVLVSFWKDSVSVILNLLVVQVNSIAHRILVVIAVVVVCIALEHHLIESVNSSVNTKLTTILTALTALYQRRDCFDLDLGKFEDNQQIAKHGQTLTTIVNRVQDQLWTFVVFIVSLSEAYQPADYDRDWWG